MHVFIVSIRVMQVFVHDNIDCWVLKNDSSPFDISSFYYYRDIYTSPCGDDGQWVADDVHQTYVYDRHCVDCPIGLYQDQEWSGIMQRVFGWLLPDKTRQTECKVCPPGTFEKVTNVYLFKECKRTFSIWMVLHRPIYMISSLS